MIDDVLNSSNDSYYFVGEENPKSRGQSRKLFPPGTTLTKGLGIVKHKLRNATRRANIFYKQLEESFAIRQALDHANKQLCIRLREKDDQIVFLNEDLDNLSVEYDKLNHENAVLEDKLRQAKSMNRELNSRCDKYAIEKHALEEKIKKLNIECDLLKAECMRNEAKWSKASQDLDTVSGCFEESKALLKKNETAIRILHRLEDPTSPEFEDFHQFKKILLPSDCVSNELALKMDSILEVVHCKVLDGSRKLKEEAQKAQAAEAKLKENEKLLAKFIKENQDLHADANMLIAEKKELQERYDSICKTNDNLEKRLRSYKFAESIEFERLVRDFNEGFSKCFKSIVELLAEMNKMNKSYAESKGPIDDQIKSIEKRADLKFLENGREILEREYLSHQIEKIKQLQNGIDTLRMFRGLQHKY